MSAYYNEIDPFAADWLRELIRAGHIAPGEAFSAAGKRKGTSDERHLWPAFFRLIRERRPVTVFGEQVASRDGLAWFDIVSSDLEGAGYACGAVDTCAAGFGAPHIRQRLYWVAHADGKQLHRRRLPKEGGRTELADSGGTVGLADAPGEQKYEEQRQSAKAEGERDADMPCGRGMACGLADAMSAGRPSRGADAGNGQTAGTGVSDAPLPTDGFWRDADWLLCRDGRWRPVEPGAFPLAHGAAGRVGRLRGYGNAIVAPQAEAFIRAFNGLLEEQGWVRQ